MTAATWSYLYQCNYVWTYIFSQPASWVTGSCSSGWQLKAREADLKNSIVYLGGYVGYNYNGCGWMSSSFLSVLGTNDGTACGTPSLNDMEFIYYTAGGVPYTWHMDTNLYDGLPHDNPQPCPYYMNYRPWDPLARPTNQIDTFPAHALNEQGGLRIRMRYMGRYPSSDGSGYYVMVHDSSASRAPGFGNWGFVPATCL